MCPEAPAGAVRRLDQVVPECAAVGILSAGAAGAASSAVPGSRAAIVTDQGITVYPARCEGGRWRAVWYEPDGSRGQCQSVSQQGLAVRLEKVTERLAADVPNMLRSGRELIGYYPVG
jgi:hypothetical protein